MIDVNEIEGVAIMTDTDNSKKPSNCLLSKHLLFFRIIIFLNIFLIPCLKKIEL